MKRLSNHQRKLDKQLAMEITQRLDKTSEFQLIQVLDMLTYLRLRFPATYDLVTESIAARNNFCDRVREVLTLLS